MSKAKSRWCPRRGLAVGLALVAGAIVVAGAAGGRSSASDARFVSHRYAFSVTIPAGWMVHRASVARPVNSPYLPTVDAPDVDSFTSPAQELWSIAVSATKVNPKLTLDAWSAGTPKRIQLTLGCRPTHPTTTTIAGSRAAVFTIPPSCGGTGWAALDYAIVRAGYGYDIVETSLPSSQVRHRVVLAQILRTFRFSR